MAVHRRSAAHRSLPGFGWLAWALYHLLSLETLLVLFLHGRHLKNVLPATPVPETLFYGILSIGVGSWLALRHGIHRRGIPIVLAGIAFTAWMFLSYGWSPSTTLARDNLPFILAINLWAIFVAACIVAGSRERMLRLLLLLLLLGGVIAFASVYIEIAHGGFRFYRGSAGTWEPRTYLSWGYIAATSAAMALGIAAHTRFGSLRQVLALAVVAASFYFVMTSGARGAALAIIVAGIFAFIVDMPRVHGGRIEIAKTQVAMLGLIVLLVSYIAYLLATGQSTSTIGRFLRLFDQVNDPLLREGANRFDYFRGAWQAWLDAPALGQGLYGFASFFCGYDLPGCYPHNAFLHVLADFGAIGLVLFLVFLFSGIRHLTMDRLRDDPLMFILGMGFVAMLFQVMVAADTATAYPFFFFLGLLALRSSDVAWDDEESEDDAASGEGRLAGQV